MKALIQRVTSAQVLVDGEDVGAIGPGLLILLGVAAGDSDRDAERLARKTAQLRIFPDGDGRFNRSALDVEGAFLVVSQFTLLADARRGNRPSFSEAAAPQIADALVSRFADTLRATGRPVKMGRFGAHMHVRLENDGPVTIMLDTHELDSPRRVHGAGNSGTAEERNSGTGG